VFGSILLLVIGFGVAYASTDGLPVGSDRQPAGIGDSHLFSLTELVNGTEFGVVLDAAEGAVG
jgi:hypothetical protein